MNEERLNTQEAPAGFASAEINEDEKTALIQEVLSGKKIEELSEEEASKRLKTISEKVTGTVDTAALEERMAGGISTDWDLNQHEIRKDKSKRGTYSAPNNGVFSWVDEAGDVWVASSTRAVYELARQSGLMEANYAVPHSNDAGEWMMHHNKFRQAEILQNLERDLANTKDERAKSIIEQEIEKIKSGYYGDANYRAAVAGRTKKAEVSHADEVETPVI